MVNVTAYTFQNATDYEKAQFLRILSSSPKALKVSKNHWLNVFVESFGSGNAELVNLAARNLAFCALVEQMKEA